jgi:5'-3' exonuclease
MDNKYQSIFAQIKAEHRSNPVSASKTKNDDILLIDGTNQFIRVWTVVPTLSDNGDHVGGVSGFLRTVGHAINLLKPTRVIIVFDGKGGSIRRQKIYPGYKNNRKTTVRVNRAYEEMSSPEIEKKEMLAQMGKLIDFLRTLPVSVVCIDNIEADDTIGYITTQMFPESKVTIMSADKDFLQLINKNVCIWSPIKKKIYGVSDVINQYGVHPTNFIYYRSLEGDKSDNIDGIRGIALKTALKLFPMIADEEEYSVDKLLAFARDKMNEKPAYGKIVENADVVNRNYRLMQLKSPDFNGSLQVKIQEATDRIYDYNKFKFIQCLTTHGMHTSISNYHIWLQENFQPLHTLATSNQ